MNRLPEHITTLTIIIFIVALLYTGSSCTKVDTPPMLEIKVQDSGGNPLSGVTLGLFDDLDEWSMLENPVQAWKETDSEGTVLFIDLQEKVYYFYADGDSINNLGRQIKLEEALRINEKRQIKITLE